MLLKGRFRGIGAQRMLDCLRRLGRDVNIIVRLARRGRGDGRLRLSVAGGWQAGGNPLAGLVLPVPDLNN